MVKKLKVAMIGSRGLPLIYGGIERHVAEISTRLAARGFEVTVFGRRPYSRECEVDGVIVKVVPAIHTKNLETATNSLLASILASLDDFDILHFHGVGPSFFTVLPWALRKKTISTIHAPDYEQSKWGGFARLFLRAGEKAALKYCSSSIVVSRKMFNRLRKLTKNPIYHIPNGATVKETVPLNEAKAFNVERAKYILAVGRFIAEKGFVDLIEAFKKLDTDLKLVIAGGSNFGHDYARLLRKRANDKVIFTGYVSQEVLDELYSNCMFYCLTSTLEGLPISLIEAMSFGRPVITSDIEESLEVAEGVSVVFRRGSEDDLLRAMKYMLSMSQEERERLGRMAKERIEKYYNWDIITDRIEEVYRNVV